MKTWYENTPAFRLISVLAGLRKNSLAVWRGCYRTLYAQDDVLIYERIDGGDIVLVATSRGFAADINLQGKLGFAPGAYRGIIADASSANTGNYLLVTPQSSTIHLGSLSSIVVRR